MKLYDCVYKWQNNIILMRLGAKRGFNYLLEILTHIKYSCVENAIVLNRYKAFELMIEIDIMTFFQASDVNSSSWISFFPTYLCERTRKPSRLILFTVIKSHKHSRLEIRNKRIEINIVKTGTEWIHTSCEQNYIESWNGLYILWNESYKKIIKLEKKIMYEHWLI